MTTLTAQTLEDLKQNSTQGVTHAAGEAIRSKNYSEFGPKIKTALPGPNAQKIVAADDRLISPSYTRSYPMVAKSGRGIRVTDVDGNEFLDFAAGIAVNSTGHCHPEVVKAIQDQAAELIHISGTDFYYDHMTRFAERLSAIAPPGQLAPGAAPERTRCRANTCACCPPVRDLVSSPATKPRSTPPVGEVQKSSSQRPVSPLPLCKGGRP